MLKRRRKAGFASVQPARIADAIASACARASSPRQHPAARVAAVEDEPTDPLGMPRGIDERDRRALRHPEQREAVDARRRRRRSRGRRPRSPRRARRARGRRARTLARRSGRAYGRRSTRPASDATPGSPSRSRDASATSPPARSAARCHGRRMPAARRLQQCRSEPAAPRDRPYSGTRKPAIAGLEAQRVRRSCFSRKAALSSATGSALGSRPEQARREGRSGRSRWCTKAEKRPGALW